MSPRRPWDPDWDWFDAPPKRPPPKSGIKMKTAGATWWGKRWIDALERMSSGYSGRLARGKTYARAGRAHDLEVSAGKVTAKVTGSREPYDVRIELAPFADAVWSKVIAAMAAKAQFAAELLAGRMPDEIDEVFKRAGKSLFPVKAADVRTECSCPDFANPCKHVAAVHFVLGEAFDRDPFLLFELRGRTKAEVLEALRAARGGEAGDVHGKRSAKRRRPADDGAESADGAAGDEVAAVRLGRIHAEDYDAPRTLLPSLRFHFDALPAAGALLKQLGAPRGWNDARTPAERLGPIVHAAAETARRIALAQLEDVAALGQPEGEGDAVATEAADGGPERERARARGSARARRSGRAARSRAAKTRS